MFFLVFFCLATWGWNILESERLLLSWHHIGRRNTEICIHGASQMEWKHGKYWKLSIVKFFVRHSVSISKFKWFEQPGHECWNELQHNVLLGSLPLLLYNTLGIIVTVARFWKILCKCRKVLDGDIEWN